MRLSAIVISLGLVFLSVSLPSSARNKTKEFRELAHLRESTAELFVTNADEIGLQSERGDGPFATCGAWNVAKVPGGYELFTAAHCINFHIPDDSAGPAEFGVSYNGVEHPVILPAVVVAVGDQSSLATDLALLYVRTDADHAVLNLSDEKVHVLDKVLNYSASYGAIMQASEGIVSALDVDIPEFDRAPWIEMMGVYRGSSGSAVVSVKTGEVIEMCNIAAPFKGFAGVRAARMKAFLSEYLIKSLPVKPYTVAHSASPRAKDDEQ